MASEKDMAPKYSVIIPSYNGGAYLPSCISSILEQGYNDYELIVSDDHSTDSTKEYLAGLAHPNLVILVPPERLSMTEHWEWALSHAKGEWILFVGQDDGLQSYFFSLSEKLIETAKVKRCKIIASRRAYWFWPGCENTYGDVAVSYSTSGYLKILPTRLMGWSALLGMRDYFELPQMYTTSLFHRSVLEKARKKQKDQVFVTHPQDANLAAIAYSFERRYLYSDIPLGWVGSSPKSAGLAITNKTKSDLGKLKESYLKSIEKSNLSFCKSIGPFSIGSTVLYFWGALLSTKCLRKSPQLNLLNNWFIKRIIFSSAYLELSRDQDDSSERMCKLIETATNNGITLSSLKRISQNCIPYARRVIKFGTYLHSCCNKRIKTMEIKWCSENNIVVNVLRSINQSIGLEDAQKIIMHALDRVLVIDKSIK